MKPAPIVLAAMAALSAPSAWAASQTFDVPPFDAVSVTAGIAAVVDVGGAQSVTAEAPNAATLSRLEIVVRDGRLDVGIKWNPLDLLFNLGQRRPVTVHITVPALVEASASAGADVDVNHASGEQLSFEASSGAALAVPGLAGDLVRIELSSGASLVASGTCDTLTIRTSSGADIDARALECATVIAEASSGGRMRTFASRSIDAEASSGGFIAVDGRPAQSRVESSSGGNVDISD